MTYRQFWITLVVVGIVTAARHYFGEGAAVAYFVGIGVLGLVGTIGHHRRRSHLTRRFGEMGEDGRQRLLIALENSQLRQELVAELDADAPTVPLRGEREVFRYPAEASRTGRWTMYGAAWLAAFLGVGAISDALLGSQRFVGPETSWWQVPSLVLAFGATAVFMWWSVRESRGALEITDDAISWRVPGRAPRIIAWGDVTDARLGEFPQAIRLRSQTQRIAVSGTLVGCGRAINLIASRVPSAESRAAS